MMPARKNRWMTWLLFRYVGWKMRRSFFGLRLHGDDSVLQEAGSYPLVLFGNHEYWWDGLMEIPLYRRYRMDYYVMMEERNLRRLPFFNHTGVFGVDLASRADRARTLLYVRRLLGQGPRRALVIFPHGRLVEPYQPWPSFEPGLEGIARLMGGRGHLVPMIKRIVPGPYPRPEAFIGLGDPVPAGASPRLADLSESLQRTCSDLEGWIRGRDFSDGIPLIPPPSRYHGG